MAVEILLVEYENLEYCRSKWHYMDTCSVNNPVCCMLQTLYQTTRYTPLTPGPVASESAVVEAAPTSELTSAELHVFFNIVYELWIIPPIIKESLVGICLKFVGQDKVMRLVSLDTFKTDNLEE